MPTYTLYQAEPASGLEEPTPLVSAVFPQSHKSGGYAQILMDTRVLSLLFMDALFSCGSPPQKGTPVDFSTLISGILGGKMKIVILWEHVSSHLLQLAVSQLPGK